MKRVWKNCLLTVCAAAVLLAGCGSNTVPVLVPVPVNGTTGTETPAPSESETPAPEPDPEPPAESGAGSETPEEPEPEPPFPAASLTAKRRVAASWGQTEGTLMVLRLTLTNDSGQPFALHHTVADLGGVTTGTAQEGMAADALADAAPMERLCAWVTTGQGQLETPLPVVLAVDGPEAVLSEGQTAVAYAYVLAPVEVADCQQVHLLADEAAIAYATFKK